MKFTKAIVLVAVFSLLSLSFAVSSFTGSAAADSDDARTYLQVYSEKGTYTKVKIQGVGFNDDSHSCGGSLNSSNGYTVVKRLSKSKATNIRCSAVGGVGSYTVSYIKGKSGNNQAVLPQVNVDTTSGKCTVIGPHVSQFKAGTMNRCPSSVTETLVKHNLRLTMCIVASNNTCTQTSATNVNVRKGPNAYVRLYDTAAVDGDPNVSRQYCSGTINYTYTNTSTGVVQGPYQSKLRFSSRGGGMDDRCTIKIGDDIAKFTSNTNYTISAEYVGNQYVNAVSSSSQNSNALSFRTK